MNFSQALVPAGPRRRSPRSTSPSPAPPGSSITSADDYIDMEYDPTEPRQRVEPTDIPEDTQRTPTPPACVNQPQNNCRTRPPQPTAEEQRETRESSRQPPNERPTSGGIAGLGAGNLKNSAPPGMMLVKERTPRPEKHIKGPETGMWVGGLNFAIPPCPTASFGRNPRLCS